MNIGKFFKFCFGCEPDIFPETIIVTPFIPAGKFSAECADITPFKGRLYSGFTASRNGRKFAAVHCGLGDRMMGDAVLLMGITSVRRILFAGACGGLGEAGIGDLIICENAFSGEGFTRYHIPESGIRNVFNSGAMIPAGPACAERLKTSLKYGPVSPVTVRNGNIFTIGSLMAETAENLRFLDEKGFIGVDMELSAVFQAARVTGRDAAALLLVSDLPVSKPVWEGTGKDEKARYNAGMSELIRTSTNFAVSGIEGYKQAGGETV
ncbi:MAG: hypothetical protein ABIA77_04130 [Candidatus Omnitrophota bacterium]